MSEYQMEPFNGLQVVAPDPEGDGGRAINDNFKGLATRIKDGPPSEDDVDRASVVEGSRWVDQNTGSEWVCTDAGSVEEPTAAAVWLQLSTGGGGTFAEIETGFIHSPGDDSALTIESDFQISLISHSSQISCGTATLTAGTFEGPGWGLTNVPASALVGDESLPDAVLSTNVAIRNGGNTFTAAQTITPQAIHHASFTATPPAGTLRSDALVAGYRFSVSEAITVHRLGRLYLTGNALDHQVTIWRASDQTAVVSATVLASAPSDDDGFKWASITPVVLDAGVEYRISINEGTDTWKDNWNGSGYFASDITHLGPCYYVAGNTYPVSNWDGPEVLTAPVMDFTTGFEDGLQVNGNAIVQGNIDAAGNVAVNGDLRCGRLGVGNTAGATTLGTLTKKLPLYDASGALVGYVPVYDSIS